MRLFTVQTAAKKKSDLSHIFFPQSELSHSSSVSLPVSLLGPHQLRTGSVLESAAVIGIRYAVSGLCLSLVSAVIGIHYAVSGLFLSLALP